MSLARKLLVTSTWLKHRSVHSCSVLSKAGHYKITPKRDRPLTYEQAHPPHRIGVTKGWTTWNASTLRNPRRQPMTVAIEDQFIRKFITGTWYKMWLSEVVIKRQHNDITICGIVCPLPTSKTMFFLKGYTEEMLSHLFKSNVKVEIQCVRSKKDLVHKYI